MLSCSLFLLSREVRMIVVHFYKLILLKFWFRTLKNWSFGSRLTEETRNSEQIKITLQLLSNILVLTVVFIILAVKWRIGEVISLFILYHFSWNSLVIGKVFKKFVLNCFCLSALCADLVRIESRKVFVLI